MTQNIAWFATQLLQCGYGQTMEYYVIILSLGRLNTKQRIVHCFTGSLWISCKRAFRGSGSGVFWSRQNNPNGKFEVYFVKANFGDWSRATIFYFHNQVRKRNHTDLCPVHLVAYKGYFAMLHYLIQNGVNVHQPTSTLQRRAVHFAALKHQVSCLQMLVSHQPVFDFLGRRINVAYKRAH